MRVYIYNAWGKEITNQECRHVGDVFSLLKLYGNWDRAYVRSGEGRLVELFVRP